MELYLVQCADDAFKILAGDGEWDTRLSSASSRLFTSEPACESAPQPIQDALAEVKAATNLPDASNALRRAITAILSEFARRDTPSA
ncbi:MAG: hypothetical protein QOI07_487 [Verrucomicrobiota bacterium]|jgi:hypothetical protein